MCVEGLIAKVNKEWTFGLVVVLDDPDRPSCIILPRAFFATKLPLIAAHPVPVLKGMGEIPLPPAIKTEKGLKAAKGWSRLPIKTSKVPLANCSSLVASSSENLRQHLLIFWDSPSIFVGDDTVNSHAIRIPACHEGGACVGAGWERSS